MLTGQLFDVVKLNCGKFEIRWGGNELEGSDFRLHRLSRLLLHKSNKYFKQKNIHGLPRQVRVDFSLVDPMTFYIFGVSLSSEFPVSRYYY